MNKSEITKRLNNLKLYGWNVKTFNYNRKMPSGCKGFVDHVLSNPQKGYLIYIEVKIGKDRESSEQSEYQKICEKVSEVNKYFQYFLMTEKNVDAIIEKIIKL
jgi:hypothetical protein